MSKKKALEIWGEKWSLPIFKEGKKEKTNEK